jgi:hypothetical protein
MNLKTRVRDWYIRWAHKSFPVRIDHSRMYVWVHLGLSVVGLAIVLRPAMVGLPLLSPDANRILGLLIVWGSGLCLIACCMGVGKFFRDANVDLRTPYGCGVFGQLSVVTSLGFYLYRLTFVAHLLWPQLMALGLSFGIFFALIHIDTVVIKEIWRIQHYKNHPECEHWAKQ